MNIERLIKPKSIAIVGASEKQGSFGNYSAINALQNGDDINVYFVNMKSDTVLGKKAYKSLSDLPEVPDSIMIITPKSTIPAILEEAGKLGVGGAIVVAAGYSEEGSEQGRADEKVIVDIAKKYDIAMMGPNCTGFVNNVDKVKMWGMGGTEFDMKVRKTGIAFFAQSGTMAIHQISCPYADISYVFSLGNSVVLNIEDVMEYVVEDPGVFMLAIYLEGVRNGRKFVNVLKRARELKKPVVIHAAGMSTKGAAAAASHTGNLASSRSSYKAICEKHGAVLVESIDEFLCATNVLSAWKDKMPKGGRIAAVNGSGGENAVCADLGELYGVPMPDLQKSTIEKLRGILPPFANPSNPLDITAITSDVDDVCVNTMKILGEDENVDAVAFTIAQFPELNDKERAQAAVFGETLNDRYGRPILKYATSEGSLPVMVLPQVEDRRDFTWRMKLREAGVPILGNSHIGFKTLAAICRFLDYRQDEHELVNSAPDRPLSCNTVSFSESDSKKMLGDSGVRFPKQAVCEKEGNLEKTVSGMNYPLVMKISSADILHKTEAGGVKLNIGSIDEAKTAYEEIIASCRTYKPEAKIDGVLVQEMAPKGVEMIIGVSSDRQFGPMLMVGMGGVFVEVFKDVSVAPCPVNKTEALNMINALKLVKLLNGYRGSPECDKDALADIMVAVSNYAYENRNTLKELDLNPVIVYEKGKGALAVDALVVKSE